MNIVSFFSGCGGLDLGFKQAGFNILWANEYDSTIHATYRKNHPETILCTLDIRKISPDQIPDADGFIGGPPCQSWSVGGASKGLADDRGKLFITYIDLIRIKKPKFFVIENVFGLTTERHYPVFMQFIKILETAGYKVNHALLNAADFSIPQDRKRIFIIGIRKDFPYTYSFPSPQEKKINLRQGIGDLSITPNFYESGDMIFEHPYIPNHDVYIGPYDDKFMARNRVRGWDEQSFTMQAQAKNCPLHPQAPPMIFISPDKRSFVPGKEYLYRRLSIRECARIQSFPDNFIFHYDNILTGYKMVGNAVPPRLARHIALSIRKCFEQVNDYGYNALVAYYRDEYQLFNSIKNKIFYIRASQENGLISSNTILPEYLIVSKAKKTLLLKIASKCHPILKTKQELIKLGFKPNNLFYWCIPLDDRQPIYVDYSPIWKDSRKKLPYFDNIKDLFNNEIN